jgi:hypothetical protein
LPKRHRYVYRNRAGGAFNKNASLIHIAPCAVRRVRGLRRAGGLARPAARLRQWLRRLPFEFLLSLRSDPTDRAVAAEQCRNAHETGSTITRMQRLGSSVSGVRAIPKTGMLAELYMFKCMRCGHVKAQEEQPTSESRYLGAFAI